MTRQRELRIWILLGIVTGGALGLLSDTRLRQREAQAAAAVGEAGVGNVPPARPTRWILGACGGIIAAYVIWYTGSPIRWPAFLTFAMVLALANAEMLAGFQWLPQTIPIWFAVTWSALGLMGGMNFYHRLAMSPFDSLRTPRALWFLICGPVVLGYSCTRFAYSDWALAYTSSTVATTPLAEFSVDRWCTVLFDYGMGIFWAYVVLAGVLGAFLPAIKDVAALGTLALLSSILISGACKSTFTVPWRVFLVANAIVLSVCFICVLTSPALGR